MDLMTKAEQLTARRYFVHPSMLCPRQGLKTSVAACSKTLSQKVATYNQRIVAEGDSLGEEVRLTNHLCCISLLIVAHEKSQYVGGLADKLAAAVHTASKGRC